MKYVDKRDRRAVAALLNKQNIQKNAAVNVLCLPVNMIKPEGIVVATSIVLIHAPPGTT